MLTEGVGYLLPTNSPSEIEKAVVKIIENKYLHERYMDNAYSLGRTLVWRNIGKNYTELFDHISGKRSHSRRANDRKLLKDFNKVTLKDPEIKLDQFFVLNDEVGILQHAFYCVPNYNEGYSTDDVTRALIASIYLSELGFIDIAQARQLVIKYLAFLLNGYNAKTDRMRNFLSYKREWNEEIGSECSHGRTIWSLGVLYGNNLFIDFADVALMMIKKLLPKTIEFEYPRSWAFVLMGILNILDKNPNDEFFMQYLLSFTEKILNRYNEYSCKSWQWFENELTYFNAKIPHALLCSGAFLNSKDKIEIGLNTLRWLSDIQISNDNYFLPIGNKGFYKKNGKRAIYDQQPIEAYSIISASLKAYEITMDKIWLKYIKRAFNWFLGENSLGLPIYDSNNGGCRDGLCSDGVNHNQGAESNLSYILAACEILKYKKIEGKYGF